MKNYNIFELFVVKQRIDDKDIYFICYEGVLPGTYVEVLTKRKINVPEDIEEQIVENLSKYYSLFEVKNYTTGKPAMLSKRELLEETIFINLLKQRTQLKEEILAQEQKEESPVSLTRKYQ